MAFNFSDFNFTSLNFSGFDFNVTQTACQSLSVQGGNLSGLALFKIVIDVYVVGTLCLFGCIGNALSIAVLNQKNDNKTVANFLLQTLAVVDTLYLLSCIVIQPLKIIYEETDWIPGLRSTFPFIEHYTWGLASIAQTMTVWMVTLVTLDRFIAICMPLRRYMRSLKRAKLAVSLVIVLAVVYNIPRFLEHETVQDKRCPDRIITRKSPFRLNKVYFVVYKAICHFVFRSIGPLMVLITLNWKLLKALRESHRMCKDMTKSDRQTNDFTLMVVVVVAVFIVCMMPDLLLRILAALMQFIPNMYIKMTTLLYINTFTNMLLVINSSINFLIYSFFGKNFRKILMQMFNCGFPRRERSC